MKIYQLTVTSVFVATTWLTTNCTTPTLIKSQTISPTINTIIKPSIAGLKSCQNIPRVSLKKLPIEAQETVKLIDRGGPFPYQQKDGSVFGNFEKCLPLAPRGTYREYTVKTPQAKNRGARRIVTGKSIKYYTPDHYKSFQEIIK